MAKKQFTNLKDLERYVKNQLANNLFFNSETQDVMIETMQRHVQSDVYDYYQPKKYVRRKHNDGLIDETNMEFTDVAITEKGVHLRFDNITVGGDFDSMMGKNIADTIEEGIRENWYEPNGAWSHPRPFIENTANELRNSEELKNAVEKDLKKLGFEVK